MVSEKHISKRRKSQEFCLRGHSLSGDNLYEVVRKDRNGAIERICKACGKVRYELNKEEIKARSKDWSQNNPDKRKDIRRKDTLKRRYGISLEQYDAMVIEQKGLCAICQKKHKLYVDHNHETKKVRKLLCRNCNLGLGIFTDDITNLVKAIQYLIGNK